MNTATPAQFESLAVELVAGLGGRASWEYPGYLSVALPDGQSYAIGVANGPVEADLLDAGCNHLDSVLYDGPLTAPALLAWIETLAPSQ